MSQALGGRWREAFWPVVRQHEFAAPLREASLRGPLGTWTSLLTEVAVWTCETLGWRAAAKGHPLDMLPIPHSEYLGLDVTAFDSEGTGPWRFPIAVMELENSAHEARIAYSLWKVLCVQADLRIVFCYRRDSSAIPALLDHLCGGVVGALSISERLALRGDTLVVIGSRGDSEVFPYGFFAWWELETNTGSFVPR